MRLLLPIPFHQSRQIHRLLLLCALPFACSFLTLITPARCFSAEAPTEMLEMVISPPSNRDAQLGYVYTNSRRQIIIEYDLGRIKDDKVYFSDGRPLYGINDNEAYALANTPGLLAQFIREHGLKPLETLNLGGTVGSVTVAAHSFGGTSCEWPYATTYEFHTDEHPLQEVIFLRRRARPQTVNYRFRCERGPGEIQLTTNFEVMGPSILLDSNGRILLAFHHPPVVFRVNPLGTIIRTRIGADIVAVPADLSRSLFDKAAESKVAPQDGVRLFESDVNAIANSKGK